MHKPLQLVQKVLRDDKEEETVSALHVALELIGWPSFNDVKTTGEQKAWFNSIDRLDSGKNSE